MRIFRVLADFDRFRHFGGIFGGIGVLLTQRAVFSVWSRFWPNMLIFRDFDVVFFP